MTAIRVLWGLFLLFHIGVYAKYMVKVKFLYKKHQALVAANKEVGKRYTLYHNKGLLALAPYVTLGWICQTVYALVKIIDQNQKIGSSVFITILYIVWRLTFYFACDTFQPALLSSLLRSLRNLDHIIALNHTLSMLHLFLTSAISITAIMPLAMPDSATNVGMISIAIFFNVTAVAMLFLGIQGAYIGLKVRQILGRSYELTKEPRTKRIMDRIAINQRQIKSTGIIQFLIYGIFGWFPYLWNKHDYMLPFAWCFVALTVRQVVNSLIQEEDQTSTHATENKSAGQNSSPGPLPDNSHKIKRPAPQESTVVGTIDAASVYEVDENAPSLLATADKWDKTKNKPSNS